MSRLNKGLFTSNTDLWATPQGFFDTLNREFNFTLDPCALPENAKCGRYFTPDIDGLKQDWGGNGVLQPTVRQGDRSMGAQGLAGEPQGGHDCRHATAGEDRYGVVSRLHLPPCRDTFHPRSPQVRRRPTVGPVPFDDSRFQKKLKIFIKNVCLLNTFSYFCSDKQLTINIYE